MPHNVRIARSGVQYYLLNELPGLGLNSIPREFHNLKVFGVYRSAQCLKNALPLFANKPIVIGHEHWVNGPYDPNVIGNSSDKTKLKMLKGEAVITNQIDFDDEENRPDMQELSPGYHGKYHWQEGVTKDGIPFQVVCDEITDVNHIALVPQARGGEDMKILDGGNNMKKIYSGLLRFAKRKAKAVNDSDSMDAFVNTLTDIMENRQRWTPEEMEEHADTLVALTADLPDSEEKDKLVRFIADVPLLKDEDDATVTEALNTLKEYYSSLDKDAISDVMEKKMDDPNKPEATAEPSATTDNAVTAEPTADTSTANQDPPAKDAETPDTNAQILQAITDMSAKFDQLIGALMKKEEPKVDDEEPKEEPKEKVDDGCSIPENGVGDQMPMYTQTMNTVNQGEDLEAMFARMKERK